MELNMCKRCGAFFVSGSNVCPNCEIKDNAELYKLKNFLSENECPSSIETLSCDTGISVKNLNRFLEQKDFSEITSQLEIDMSSNTNIEL